MFAREMKPPHYLHTLVITSDNGVISNVPLVSYLCGFLFQSSKRIKASQIPTNSAYDRLFPLALVTQHISHAGITQSRLHIYSALLGDALSCHDTSKDGGIIRWGHGRSFQLVTVRSCRPYLTLSTWPSRRTGMFKGPNLALVN